jgi:hypothetical protein
VLNHAGLKWKVVSSPPVILSVMIKGGKDEENDLSQC